MASASAEMQALGHQSMGEEHVLFAGLRGTGDLVGQLAELGLSHEAVRDVAASRVPLATSDEWRSSEPSYHVASGRAEGLALGLGHKRPGAAHWLTAAIWEPDGPASALLAALDVQRDAVLAATGLRLSHPANSLYAAGERQAVAIRDGYVGDWHVLLALLAGEPDALARTALEACGLTHAACAARVADMAAKHPGRKRHEPSGARRPNPHCRQLLGRAEGLAATEAAAAVRSEHVLVAHLWEPGFQVVAIESWGATEPEVAQALADLGVRLPSTPRDERDRAPWGEPVYVPYDRLMDAVHMLNAAGLPLGSWGFNHDYKRGWVLGKASVDLRAIIGDLALPATRLSPGA